MGPSAMSVPSPAKDDQACAIVELAAALHDMRDSLVELSLMLQDLQFEMTCVQRNAIEERLNVLMQKVKPR